MKKVLFVLLALTVAAMSFAELSVGGSIQMDLGASIGVGDSAGDQVWYFDMFDNGNTWIQAKAEFDKVSAWVRVRPDGSDNRAVWMGNATLDLDPLAFSVGFNRLPVAYWSSFELWGDNNYAYGASSTSRTAYVQLDFADFYFGIAEGNAMHGKLFKQAWSPYFYLGYNFDTDDEKISVGAAFVAAHLGKNVTSRTDSVFTFMGKVHAKFDFDLITLGLNAALYGSPDATIFNVCDNPVVSGRTDNMVLEGLVDVGFNLEPCFLSLSGGLVVNLADEAKGGGGIGMKFAANAIFDIGGTGFCIIPGIALTTNSYKIAAIKMAPSWIDAGVSFYYSF